MFPSVERKSKVFDNPVTEDSFPLALNSSDLAHLVSIVVHVGQKSPSVILQEDARKSRPSYSLLLAIEVILREDIVLDGLESSFFHSVVEFCSGV